MKKILFLLFISSSLFALDKTSEGLMCEGVDNKDNNRLDVWNSFEYLIIDSDEKKSLSNLSEVISIYQHGICGFQKHDSKINLYFTYNFLKMTFFASVVISWSNLE